MKDRYILGIIFSTLIIIGIPIWAHPEPDWLVYYNVPLATLSYIAVIATAIFIGYQAKLFLKDYTQKNKRAEFELSYRMANYYSTEIIPYMASIKHFLIAINKNIDPTYKSKVPSFAKFTASEATEIFGVCPDGKEVVAKFEEYFTKPMPESTLIKLFSLHDGKTQLELKKEWDVLLENKTPQERNIFFADKTIEFCKNTVSLFNKIEYFSMFFCSGLAIPENVYMSLHQTFLGYLHEGYLFICNMNKNPGHEYYMHTIDLYSQWQHTFMLDENKRKQSLKEALTSTCKSCVPKKMNQG